MDDQALTWVCAIDFDPALNTALKNKDMGTVVLQQLVEPPNEITGYLTHVSGITTTALDHVTTTLADLQTHLRTLIKPSATLLGHSTESDGAEIAWLTCKLLGRIIQIAGLASTTPRNMRVCIDFLECAFFLFREDSVPILKHIVRSHSRNRESNDAPTRTAIVDHGSPGAWHDTLATAPANTVARTSDAEVFDGLRGVMDSHETRITPKRTVSSSQKRLKIRTGWGCRNFNRKLGGRDAFHGAIPPRTALLLFSGSSDPQSMSTLTARQEDCQASIRRIRVALRWLGRGTEGGNGALKHSEDRWLEEAVVQVRMGLLFVRSFALAMAVKGLLVR
ncbi:hypothetical protein V8E53_004006 [Lactarius tabidus]